MTKQSPPPRATASSAPAPAFCKARRSRICVSIDEWAAASLVAISTKTRGDKKLGGVRASARVSELARASISAAARARRVASSSSAPKSAMSGGGGVFSLLQSGKRAPPTNAAKSARGAAAATRQSMATVAARGGASAADSKSGVSARRKRVSDSKVDSSPRHAKRAQRNAGAPRRGRSQKAKPSRRAFAPAVLSAAKARPVSIRKIAANDSCAVAGGGFASRRQRGSRGKAEKAAI